VVTGPLFAQVDLSLAKRINVTSRITFDFMGHSQRAQPRELHAGGRDREQS
jgi:hypothetical protein